MIGSVADAHLQVEAIFNVKPDNVVEIVRHIVDRVVTKKSLVIRVIIIIWQQNLHVIICMMMHVEFVRWGLHAWGAILICLRIG